MKIQWHPLFAQLLKPLVEDYYDVQLNVPVGEAPREADLILLRLTSSRTPPFEGLWKALTLWNILEFKGPSVSARLEDLRDLVELGLGIGRRLNVQQVRQRRSAVPAEQISFWYLANHLGRRFLQAARRLLGELTVVGPGVWRSEVLGHPLLLVSTIDLAVELDSIPLHLIEKGSPATRRAVAEYVARQTEAPEVYASWLASVDPGLWAEVRVMAKTKRPLFEVHMEPLVEMVGLEGVIQKLGGFEQIAKKLGMKKVVQGIGLKNMIEEVGLKNVIEEVGLKNVIEEVGLKNVVDEIGIDDLLAGLSPSQRQELKRRLK